MKLKDLLAHWQNKADAGDALAKVTALAIKEAILLRSPAKAFQIEDARYRTDMTLMSTKLSCDTPTQRMIDKQLLEIKRVKKQIHRIEQGTPGFMGIRSSV